MSQRGCFYSNKIITVQESDKIQDAIEEAENKVVRILPNQYIVEVDCKNNPITVPDNCIIQAYGAELIFRFTNPDGYWYHQILKLQDIQTKIFGGKWWIDRANSVNEDARRLFYVNNSEIIIQDIQADNGSGRETFSVHNSKGTFLNCLFRPLQNVYTSNNYIRAESGSCIIVDSCEFDGFYHGQTILRMYTAVENNFDGYIPVIIKNSLFKHLRNGIYLVNWTSGKDSGILHVSNCEFIDFSSTWTDSGPICFKTYGVAGDGYCLKELTIENSVFRGGCNQTGQIGVRRYESGNTGIQRLILRNLAMYAEGEYTTAKYAIDFPEAGSGDSIIKIAEMSNIFCSSGYGSQAININNEIPIGKYDVTLES